jgi:hypothetical protein
MALYYYVRMLTGFLIGLGFVAYGIAKAVLAVRRERFMQESENLRQLMLNDRQRTAYFEAKKRQ